MRWYADNSELNGIRGSDIPDILLFGGVAVEPAYEMVLRSRIEQVKAKYGHPRAPIKWNFRDLKALYQKQNQEPLYKKMLETSKEWRLDLANAVSDIEFTVILACIESHSIDKKVIKDVKEDLTGFVFSNGLMRVALHVQEAKPLSAQVVLDWPDQGDTKPFDSEYMAAYNFGKTKGGEVGYHSGQLSKLGFMDSPMYTNMRHSTLLQFADLVLGSTREIIECATGKKSTSFGLDFAKILRSKYRGYPNKIFGRGVSVASGNVEFRSAIRNYLIKELGE